MGYGSNNVPSPFRHRTRNTDCCIWFIARDICWLEARSETNGTKEIIMAVLSVDKVFQFAQFVSNKESRGWVNPAEFNVAAELAQIAVYSRLENGFIANKKLHSDMRPFLKTSTETIAANVIPFPTGFRQLLECRMVTGGHAITELTQAEVAGALNSTIVAPSATYPACTVRDTAMAIYPTTTTGNVIVEFIAGLTTAPLWDYTLVSSRPVYDVSGSTQFELHDNLFLEIAMLVIANIGVNIKEESISQYALAFNNQG